MPSDVSVERHGPRRSHWVNQKIDWSDHTQIQVIDSGPLLLAANATGQSRIRFRLFEPP